MTDGLGDHVGIAGVGLGLSAVSAGHPVHRASGDVEDVLVVGGGEVSLALGAPAIIIDD